MVYQPTQQYGQQQSATSMPGYGQPAMPGQGQVPSLDSLKFGLPSTTQYKVPVIGFIGRLTSVALDTQSQYGLRLVEKYDQVQILESPVAWPWATIDISIKYSDKEGSAMGRHFASAKVLGIGLSAQNVAEMTAALAGNSYELHQADESFGEDRSSGEKMHGDVWRFIRISSPNIQPQSTYAMPLQSVSTGPTIQQPVAPQTTVKPVDVTLLPTDTPAVRAKKLLHGRALNEFMQVALADDKVKDPAFIGSIYDQSFIVGLKGSGQIVLGADGKFQVIA